MATWQVVPLGAIATVSAGNSAPQDKKLFINGKHPFIRTSDVGQVRFGEVAEVRDYLNDDGVKKLRRFPRGTILFPKSGASTFLDHRVVMAMDGYVASHLATIVADNEEVNERFLLYYLSTISARDLVQDQNYPSLNLPLIAGIRVPVPPLTEQRRIVARLDEAFAAIQTATAAAEKNLANARELFERILDQWTSPQSTGWRRQELQQDVRFIDYRGRTPKKTKSGLRLITAKNVRMGRLRVEPQEFVAPDSYDDWMTRGIPRRGDVLFTTEAPLGLVAILDTSERVVFAQRIITLQPNRDAIDPTMLSYALRSKATQVRIHQDATGATATGIKASLLKKVPVSLPDCVNQQRELAGRLTTIEDACNRLASLAESKLAHLAGLRQAVLSASFDATGTAAELVNATQTRQRTSAERSSAPGINPTDMHAGILAIAFRHHDNAGTLRYLGHVKGEKIAHLVESHVGVSLGRSPKKDAAGPNDYPHLRKVESRAKKAGFFTVTKVGERYEFDLGSQFQKLIDKAEAALGERLADVQALLDLLTPLTTQQAEIVATVYAAWNNLLLAGDAAPADEAIVREAREDWHPKKLEIPRQKFFKAIEWMRKKELVPRGKGQPVE